MARRPCCSKEGLNRGAWTVLEDKLLKSYIMTHGDGNWRSLPKKAGLKRCGKSCRLRWLNYLRPDIKRGNISEDEEELIIRLHNLLGNRWSLIAGRLPGRTDNEIKNYWNTALAKKAKSNNICKSKPESSPETSQQENNISKVIRTKATRCRAKLVFFPSPVLNPVITSSDHNDDDRLSPLPLLVSDFESTLEGHEIFNGVLNDRERDEDHRLGLTLNFDDRDDWVPNSTDLSCLGDGDNDTMDFESLAFLLESDEWPSSAIN